MANKKFSDFTTKTSTGDVDFLVGFDGSDNVKIAPDNLKVGGGSDTQIQFNNSGLLGGGSFLTTNKSNKLEVTYELGLKGDGGSNQGLLKLYCEAGAAHHVGIKGPAHSGGSSYTLQLPNTLPNVANQILESNASGALSWIATPSGGGGVTSIIAGSGISVNQATGAVTVTASGGGGGASALNDLSDVSTTSNSAYFINIPANVTGGNNLIMGDYAGNAMTSAASNVVLGRSAMQSNTTGGINTVMGYSALSNATNQVSNAVAIGAYAGQYNGNAYAGVMVGASAARNADSTYATVVIGQNAGRYSDSTYGTFIGSRSGYNGGGSYSIRIGYNSGYATTGGSNGQHCISLGYESMKSGTSGSYNVFLGSYSGDALTTGHYNTGIGYGSGTNMTTGSNNTFLGNGAVASAIDVSNEITLGNSSVTSLRCAVTSITSLSDQRDKTGITNLSYGLDFINLLQPREFVWNNRSETIKQQAIDENGKPVINEDQEPVLEEVQSLSANKGKKDFGFIAQEVQKLDNDTLRLVYDANPDKLELSYGKLVPVLVKAVQELSAEVESLKAKLA